MRNKGTINGMPQYNDGDHGLKREQEDDPRGDGKMREIRRIYWKQKHKIRKEMTDKITRL